VPLLLNHNLQLGARRKSPIGDNKRRDALQARTSTNSQRGSAGDLTQHTLFSDVGLVCLDMLANFPVLNSIVKAMAKSTPTRAASSRGLKNEHRAPRRGPAVLKDHVVADHVLKAGRVALRIGELGQKPKRCPTDGDICAVDVALSRVVGENVVRVLRSDFLTEEDASFIIPDGLKGTHCRCHRQKNGSR